MNGIGAATVTASGIGPGGSSGGGNSATNSNNPSGGQKDFTSGGGGGGSAVGFGLLPQVSITGGLNPSSTNTSNITVAAASSGIISGSSTTAAVAAAAFLDPGSTSLGLGAFELEEVIHARTLWWESTAARRFMRFCALLSLISVSLNTSNT